MGFRHVFGVEDSLICGDFDGAQGVGFGAGVGRCVGASFPFG